MLDSNDGLTTGTPKQSFPSAITAANAGGVPVFALKPGIYRGARGPNGTAINVSFVLEPWAADPTALANRVWLIRKSATTAFSWVSDSGIYRRSTTTGADPIHVFDLALDDGKGLPRRYPKAADLAACQATSGTWWRDSGTGNLYVHAYDNRNLVGDGNIELSSTGTNMNVIPTASINCWMQNIAFGCGDSAFVCNFTTNTGLTINAYLKDCIAFGSGANDGFAFDADLANCVLNAYQKRCKTAYNLKDGFNYHISGSGGASLFVFDDEGYGGETGYDAGLANNAFTLHEQCKAISLNCVYEKGQDRNIHHVGAAKHWMLGGRAGASRATSGDTTMSVVSGHPDGTTACTIWLDSVSIDPSATASLWAYGASDKINYAKMDVSGLVKGGAGTIAAYTP